MRKKISIFFLIVFILAIISLIILKIQIDRLDGDAISGYKNNGEYFIMTNDISYVEVSKFEYYIDIIIWVAAFVFFGLSGIGMLFFISAYGLPFTFKLAEEWKKDMFHRNM